MPLITTAVLANPDLFPAVTRLALGGDVSITNTVGGVVILTQAITIPSRTGTYRVFADWSVMCAAGGSSTTVTIWVKDDQGGNQVFANNQNSITAAFVGGFSGSGWSRNIYAASTIVNFDLRGRMGSTGTAKAAPLNEAAETFIELTVFQIA